MNVFVLALLIIICYGVISLWRYQKKYERQIQELFLFDTELFKFHDELHGAIANGLYLRFKKANEGEEKEENPFEFEKFAAKVMENYYGGTAIVTKASGDYGVDIEHERDDGLYLGQVKCYWGPVGYEPIAIVHSQMVKQNAKGGFIITTSTFTANAEDYAKDVNIELIDGKKFAKYWVYGIDNKINTVKELKLQLEPQTNP